LNDIFNINGTLIAPGEQAIVRIPVGRLPTGNQITISVNVFRSTRPGPVLFLSGGIHGDEINGIEILRQAIEQKLFDNLLCGSVIAIPLVNVFGFINFSRDVSDGKDVNRSFPGSINGSMAARVARILTRHILPLITVGVDFHTGGQSRYNYPQVRFTNRQPSSKILADAFNAPFSIVKPTILRSLRRMALDMGIPIIVYEGGEANRVDAFPVNQALRGIKRILSHLEMSQYQIEKQENIILTKSSWLRSNIPGLFYPVVNNGSQIVRGELLGWIHDPLGHSNVAVTSKLNGHLFCINNRPVVYPGDPLFAVGML
jgi:uncharacterized protein